MDVDVGVFRFGVGGRSFFGSWRILCVFEVGLGGGGWCECLGLVFGDWFGGKVWLG